MQNQKQLQEGFIDISGSEFERKRKILGRKTYRDKYAIYYQILGELINSSPQSSSNLRYRTGGGGSSFKKTLELLTSYECLEQNESTDPFQRWHNRANNTVEKVTVISITEKGRRVHVLLSKYLDYLPNSFLMFETIDQEKNEY